MIFPFPKRELEQFLADVHERDLARQNDLGAGLRADQQLHAARGSEVSPTSGRRQRPARRGAIAASTRV